jgi:putative heme-binding domain-containing protein
MNRSARLAAVAIGVTVILLAHVRAQRSLTDIPPPDPARELQSLKVADEFEVNLFASDPLIRKPIQMNWDAEGRLWISTSTTYPQIKPGQKAEDRIRVLEDRDGDGRADRASVFAEDLHIPTGLVPGDGGVYVANATEILHLRDTDGDGKADTRRVVLSGFGTEDVHHMIHTFRWGADGMLYFNQSIYTHSHIETPWGVRRLRAGGVWQLRPESLRLEVFARGFVNPWGHQFDRWGESFVTDGAYTEGINHVFPGAAFVSAHDARRTLRGLNPGQPKHSGLEILSGRHIPESFAGSLVTNDYRGNRVNRFVLSEDGSGFASRQVEDLAWSSHVAFRPVDVRMGPDGAIYVADWYNPIIQHGEVDFRDPRRDHTHGRIWRITAKGRPLVRPPKLAGASAGALLDALKLPEGWTREQARRLLRERGAREVLPALDQWVSGLRADDPEVEHHRLEALWLYQALDSPREALATGLLKKVLTSADHHARAAGMRVLYSWHDRVPAIDALLARGVEDRHPRVKLETLHVLRRRGTADAARAALGVMDAPLDVNLDFALAHALETLEPHWLPRLEADPSFFGADARRVVYALKAARDPGAMKLLLRAYRAGLPARKDRQEALEVLVARGGPDELGLVLELALDGRMEAAERTALVEKLDQAAESRKIRPRGDLERIGALLDGAETPLRSAAARLAGRWQLASAGERLKTLARDRAQPDALRHASIDGLALLGRSEAKALLAELAASGETPRMRIASAAALATLDVEAGARTVAEVLATVPPETDAAPMYDALLARERGAAALAAALANRRLSSEAALTGLRRLSTSGRPSEELEKALVKAGGEALALPRLTAAELARLALEVRERGDTARGESIYRSDRHACMSCHAIAGAGGTLGPDLTSIGASAQIDYLIESLLDPGKQIKEGFHLVTLKKQDGSVASGIAVRNNDEEVVLRDGADREVAIPKASIQESGVKAISLMPPSTGLRRDELLDLTRFLSELGRVGRYDPPKARLVRTWRVLDASPEAAALQQRQGREHLAVANHGLRWTPWYSTVAGELPAADLPVVVDQRALKFSYVRFDLRVSTPGEVALGLHHRDGVILWIGTKPFETGLAARTVLNLAAGTHTITLSIDRARWGDQPLRVELLDLSGSSARAQLVTGK